MLKKFKVVTPFNGYREGMTVAFNGADAEKYKAFIISAEKPAVIEPVYTEVKAAAVEVKPNKKRVVKKGRK